MNLMRLSRAFAASFSLAGEAVSAVIKKALSAGYGKTGAAYPQRGDLQSIKS
jgi:hypothetical protein